MLSVSTWARVPMGRPSRAGACGARSARSQVSLHLPSSNAQFMGKLEPAKADNLDCVAVFDGKGWRLELLSATIRTQ